MWQRFIVIVMLLGGLLTTSAGAQQQPLPATQAFQLSITGVDANKVLAKWVIAPGYYLYRDHLRFTAVPNTLLPISFPANEMKPGLHRAEAVYSGTLSIPLEFKAPQQPIQLTVEYQGCSRAGFCYPPQTQVVTLHASGSKVSAATPQFNQLLANQNAVLALLMSEPMWLWMLVFAGLGLLLAFTPCVLPMIPILTSIIVGQDQESSTKKAFFLSAVYVLGSALTYAGAGVAAAYMGSSLQAWLQTPWIIVATSLIFVLLALSLFNMFQLRLPHFFQHLLHKAHQRTSGGNYAGVFLMGALSTLIVSPCVTAPLVGVLLYIGQTGDMVIGASALFALGLGMGLPLLLIGTSAGRWLPKSGPWMDGVKHGFGLLMLAMAIWLLARIIPLSATLLLLSALLALAAWMMSHHLQGVFGRAKAISMSSALIIILASSFWIAGGAEWLPSSRHIEARNGFITVRSLSELQRALAEAKASRKPALVDFYADWCESCVAMERNVFQRNNVQGTMSNYVLIRADLSANNADDEALLKQYNVVAPPTVLFFTADGRELISQRIIGEVTSHDFMTRANRFYASCAHTISC